MEGKEGGWMGWVVGRVGGSWGGGRVTEEMLLLAGVTGAGEVEEEGGRVWFKELTLTFRERVLSCEVSVVSGERSEVR